MLGLLSDSLHHWGHNGHKGHNGHNPSPKTAKVEMLRDVESLEGANVIATIATHEGIALFALPHGLHPCMTFLHRISQIQVVGFGKQD